jgi:ornithine cyclodeaminase
MNSNAVSILGSDQIAHALAGKERAILQAVADAYRVHAEHQSALPHSSFLRFPGLERERIIALPAYLGGPFSVAGLKWISSFPENIRHGLERASAVLLLNALDTGRVYAVLESSLISAVRTAASAALAAERLSAPGAHTSVGLVGCGAINFQVLRFLRVVRPELDRALLFDLDPARAQSFQRVAERLGMDTTIAASSSELFEKTRLISLATTAVNPHLSEHSGIRPGSLILHVSLRDLVPSMVLDADNVVDDVDHVCRANTSLHLAEQQVSHRNFIRTTLGDILSGKAAATPTEPKALTVFSPFGLGILDLAVGKLAYQEAMASQKVTVLDGFHPRPWSVL